jgi:hypothetical protein
MELQISIIGYSKSANLLFSFFYSFSFQKKQFGIFLTHVQQGVLLLRKEVELELFGETVGHSEENLLLLEGQGETSSPFVCFSWLWLETSHYSKEFKKCAPDDQSRDFIRSELFESMQDDDDGDSTLMVNKKSSRDSQKSILIFSGGSTNEKAGPISEAQSYWILSRAMKWFRPSFDESNVKPIVGYSKWLERQERIEMEIEKRTYTEDFARDSFENLLFSICRGQEVTQRKVEYLTVVSFEFKKVRFYLHALASHFSLYSMRFIGVDPVDSTELYSARAGELSNALAPYQRDPYACFDKIIHDKRHQRNPQHHSHGYLESCPNLKEIFLACGFLYDRNRLINQEVALQIQAPHHILSSQSSISEIANADPSDLFSISIFRNN